MINLERWAPDGEQKIFQVSVLKVYYVAPGFIAGPNKGLNPQMLLLGDEKETDRCGLNIGLLACRV